MSEDAGKEFTLEVFDPSGEVRRARHIAPRHADLHGKTVCLLSNDIWEAGRVLGLLGKILKQRVPGAKTVPPDELPALMDMEHGPSKIGVLKDKGCDAVILGNGG